MATTAMPNVNQMEWKAKMTVMKEIMKHEGVVFGGAVRDWYIHNYNASKFYEAIKDKDNHKELMKKYTDPTFLPEFKDRTVIPNDIDATIPKTCVKGLLESLSKKGFRVANRFKHDAKTYFPHMTIGEGQIMHERYIVTHIPATIAPVLMTMFPTSFTSDIAILKEINRFSDAMMNILEQIPTISTSFIIDLMVSQDGMYYEPPFGNLDFECNGLLMNQGGFRLSKLLAHTWDMCPIQYNKVFNRILEDILHYRAIVVHRDDVQTYRVKKMVQKGWTILNFQTVQYMDVPVEKAYDGYCLICQDTLPSKHYKMKCCDARFHAKCLIRTVTEGVAAMNYTGMCVMCKNSDRSPHQYELDSLLVETICEYSAKPAVADEDAVGAL